MLSTSSAPSSNANMSSSADSSSSSFSSSTSPSASPSSASSFTTGGVIKACCCGNVDLVRRLITGDRSLITVPNSFGMTPLMASAFHGKYAVASILLNAGADPNQQNPTGTTALHFAVCANQLELVRLLLLFGADPSLRESRGNRDALQIAVMRQHTKIQHVIEAHIAGIPPVQTKHRDQDQNHQRHHEHAGRNEGGHLKHYASLSAMPDSVSPLARLQVKRTSEPAIIVSSSSSSTPSSSASTDPSSTPSSSLITLTSSPSAPSVPRSIPEVVITESSPSALSPSQPASSLSSHIMLQVTSLPSALASVPALPSPSSTTPLSSTSSPLIDPASSLQQVNQFFLEAPTEVQRRVTLEAARLADFVSGHLSGPCDPTGCEASSWHSCSSSSSSEREPAARKSTAAWVGAILIRIPIVSMLVPLLDLSFCS